MCVLLSVVLCVLL